MGIKIRSFLFVVLAFTVLTPGTIAQSSGPPTVLYRLQPGSVYEEGCYGLCMCPILQAPMEGTFGLRVLPTGSPLNTYAVEVVDFQVPALDLNIDGSGFYSFAGEFNEMELDLQLGGNPEMHFSSFGLIPSGAEFPDIDVVVSVNQMMECFDYVLHIVASPATTPHPWLSVADADLEWSPVNGAIGYDVVCGDLMALRNATGDYSGATDQCLADSLDQTAMGYDVTPDTGGCLWFLVRDDSGSYDSGGQSQAGSRDAGIAASAPACP